MKHQIAFFTYAALLTLSVMAFIVVMSDRIQYGPGAFGWSSLLSALFIAYYLTRIIGIAKKDWS